MPAMPTPRPTLAAICALLPSLILPPRLLGHARVPLPFRQFLSRFEKAAVEMPPPTPNTTMPATPTPSATNEMGRRSLLGLPGGGVAVAVVVGAACAVASSETRRLLPALRSRTCV